MADAGSYQASRAHVDLEHEARRLEAQVERTWAKEARSFRWLGLEDGMSILECGCGPGFMTERLERLLPHSPITALDIDPDVIGYAQARRAWHAQTTFVTVSIHETSLPVGQVDFAIARFVFQHLRRPEEAALTLRGLLRPGGKLVAIDSDDGLAGLVEPALPELAMLQPKVAMIQALHGGDRRVGRKLWRILADAGFTALEQDAILTSSDAQGLEPFLLQLDPDRMMPLIREGLLQEEDMALAERAHARLAAAEHPLVIDLIFLVCGTNPRADPQPAPQSRATGEGVHPTFV